MRFPFRGSTERALISGCNRGGRPCPEGRATRRGGGAAGRRSGAAGHGRAAMCILHVTRGVHVQGRERLALLGWQRRCAKVCRHAWLLRVLPCSRCVALTRLPPTAGTVLLSSAFLCSDGCSCWCCAGAAEMGRATDGSRWHECAEWCRWWWWGGRGVQRCLWWLCGGDAPATVWQSAAVELVQVDKRAHTLAGQMGCIWVIAMDRARRVGAWRMRKWDWVFWVLWCA